MSKPDPEKPSAEAKKLCMTPSATVFGRRPGGDSCPWDDCLRCLAIDAALEAAEERGRQQVIAHAKARHKLDITECFAEDPDHGF